MKYFILIIIFFIYGCKVIEEDPPPCNGEGCKASFYINNAVSDPNGYWHIKYNGYNYFQIRGQLNNLSKDYYINGVPLIETQYDSDYWILFDTIQWRIPVYSPFSLYRDRRFNDPIPVGDTTYTLFNIARELFPPINIVGYSLPRDFDPSSYIQSLYLKTRSAYTMRPVQNIFLHPDMRNDTASIFITAQFNNDLGRREEIHTIFKVIFD
jgi:hypothetical protein